MAILTRLITILDTINTYVPQPFAGKPYKATWTVIDGATDTYITCRASDTGNELHTFKLSEHEHWDADIVGGDIITELNELSN